MKFNLSVGMGLGLITLAIASPAGAGGGVHGGGGTQIEAAFRMRGYGLVVRVAHHVQANTLCQASVMQTGLDHAKVRVVDHLIDPATGQSPADPNLDAYTVAGDIQLLQKGWQILVDPSTPARTVNGRSVDVLILHEIYRSTGSCADDHFETSDKVFNMLQGLGATSTFSEMFAFTHLYWMNFYENCVGCGYDTMGYALGLEKKRRSNFSKPLLCERDLDQGAGTCVDLDGNIGKGITLFEADSNHGIVGGYFWAKNSANLKSFATVYESVSDFYRPETENQWVHVSPEHPFLLVHDIQNGSWSWGIR